MGNQAKLIRKAKALCKRIRKLQDPQKPDGPYVRMAKIIGRR
jgi:hypothetical protein